jgi:outer membrane protein, heavy metal efflux system
MRSFISPHQLLLALLLISPLWSQEALPNLNKQSTLSDYLAYAALNNPGLEAAFDRWKAALERVPQAKSLPDPRFSYRHYIEEVETRRGPMRNAFDLSQSFPWFGKLDLAGDVASEAARVAEQQYEAIRDELFFNVTHAYYEFYYLLRALAVSNENLALIKHLESVARTRYKTASGSHPDVIRAQVELGKVEDRLIQLQELRAPVAARLNAVLNRNLSAEIAVPSSFEPSATSIQESTLMDRLVDDNPRLLALSHEVDKYSVASRLAKKQFAPNLALGVNYIDIGSYSSVPTGIDNGRDAVSVMLSINIPLWGQKYSAGVREAKLKRQAASKQKSDLANQLKAQLKMALYKVRDAKRKLDLYGQGLVPKAQQSLKVTEQSYRSGDGSFLDLIDAQRTLLEFQLAYQRALADHEQALARIELLVGGDIIDQFLPHGKSANADNTEETATPAGRSAE